MSRKGQKKQHSERDGVLRLRLLDEVTRKAIKENVDIELRHRKLAKERRVARGVDGSKTIVIEDLLTQPRGFYSLDIKPKTYRRERCFVNIESGGPTKLVIDLVRKEKDREVTVQDLVRRMVRHPEIAARVIAEPGEFQEEFSLSDRAVVALGNLEIEDLQDLGPQDPSSFAAGAVATGFLPDIHIEVGEIQCYYGG